LYFVPNRSGAPAVPPLPEAVAPEPAGVDAAGAEPTGADGDGLDAPWHAASTIIALANTPINRFCMDSLLQ
jgi:hypothetical protein